MANSHNEQSYDAKLEFLKRETSKFESELQTLLQDLNLSTNFQISEEISNNFQTLQFTWDSFTTGLITEISDYKYQAKKAFKDIKEREIEEMRVFKLKKDFEMKEQQIKINEKELSTVLAKVKDL